MIIMSIEEKDNTYTKNIARDINISLLGELKQKDTSIIFLKYLENGTLEITNSFIYMILIHGVKSFSDAISPVISKENMLIIFIDNEIEKEIYSIETNKLTSRKLIKHFKKIFMKKLWIRNFTRSMVTNIDKKADKKYQEKEFLLKDIKNISAFLQPINQALGDNKKPILRKHFSRLVIAESAIKKEISTTLMMNLFDNDNSKKKKLGFSRRLIKWTLIKGTFGLWLVVFPANSEENEEEELA